jgi:hypothetical protein
MITWLFLQMALLLMGGLLGLFPSYTLPDSVTNLGSTVGDAVATANGIFPVVTLGICIGIVAAVWLLLAAFDALMFVWRALPFKAS